LFRPKYVSLAREFQKHYPKVEFYAVSCVAHQDICQQYKVDAYPSLYTINAGENSEAILLKPGKLSVATLEEAFGFNNDADALPLAAAGAARNSNAAARESRDLEGQDEESAREGKIQRQRPDDDNVVKDNSNDPNDPDDVDVDDEDGENKGGDSLGGFQDSANEMLRKIGAAAKKEFLDPFIANQQEDEGKEDEDDTDDPVQGGNNNSNKGNANSRNRHADYEEEEEDGEGDNNRRGKRSPAARTKKLDEDDEDDEENAFETLANVAGLTVREKVVQKPGAALARQRRGDLLPLRTKEGLRTSVLKRKGETTRRGATVLHSLTNNRNNRHNKFAPSAPKPGLRPEDKPAPAGETDTMKAHRKGTQEFEDRKALILAEIERVKGLKVRQEVERKWAEIMKAQGEKGRAPYKKVVAKPRLVERLPIVKRLVTRMGEEEALMLDTSLSFLHGLRMGVYKEPGPLTQRKKETLRDWLDLMSIALPQEWGLQTAIDDLSDNIELISQDQKSLERILFRHKLHRVTWSDSCTPKKDDIGISGGGFTCGFWKLLHTMTIGIAEHRGGQVRGLRWFLSSGDSIRIARFSFSHFYSVVHLLFYVYRHTSSSATQMLIDSGIVSPKTRTFTPLEAANTLRRYMDHFYICSECSRNFIAENIDCAIV
jgi:Thioredoxin